MSRPDAARNDADDDADDAALRWGNEVDPTYTETPVAPDAPPSADAPADRPQLGSFELVAYGILAGIYLLYTVGWAFVVSRTVGSSPVLLATIMFQLGQFLAIAAAPLWFLAAFTLTRGRRPVVRLTWLLIGAVVLVPLPFVLGV